MKIVVIGGCGWVGSHLVRKLTEKGYDVVVISRSEPLIPFNLSVHHIKYNVACLLGASYVDSIRDADVIVSLPGQLGSVASLEDPLGSMVDSVVPHLTLLKVLADNELTPTVVFPSSHLVYKEPARCVYTANKKVVEEYLQIYQRAFGIPYVILRAATAYGPLQKRNSVVNFFIKRALEGKTIPVYEDVRDDHLAIVYIDDMVDVIMLVCERLDYKCNTYSVLASQPKIMDIARTVSRLLGGEIELTETPELVKSVGSGDFLITALGPPGWNVEVGLEDGILKTAQWLKGGAGP